MIVTVIKAREVRPGDFVISFDLSLAEVKHVGGDEYTEVGEFWFSDQGTHGSYEWPAPNVSLLPDELVAVFR